MTTTFTLRTIIARNAELEKTARQLLGRLSAAAERSTGWNADYERFYVIIHGKPSRWGQQQQRARTTFTKASKPAARRP